MKWRAPSCEFERSNKLQFCAGMSAPSLGYSIEINVHGLLTAFLLYHPLGFNSTLIKQE